MGRITTSDLHGYIIDERNTGSLSEIPATLYEEIHADIVSIYNEASSREDPFSEGVQSLLKERESLREYVRELYNLRTKKILALALAKANGEEIDRTDVRMMVPGERMLFDVVCESASSCRKTLLDGKPTLETTAYNYVLPEVQKENDSLSSELINESPAETTDEDSVMRAVSAEKAPEENRVIAVKDKIPEFQDLSGRIYSLSPGDIVSLPSQMADVLCKDNKALSIRIRK
ncbi:MAG: DNA replication complex GINS family protein [Methanocorpusculum sp.]|nr:DNA replication complex GINS family protein [Methanocorpusculum sp.]